MAAVVAFDGPAAAAGAAAAAGGAAACTAAAGAGAAGGAGLEVLGERCELSLRCAAADDTLTPSRDGSPQRPRAYLDTPSRTIQ